MNRPSVLALGSLNADFQARIERIPGPGESVRATRWLRAGGGKAANACLLARRLDISATLLACAGDDELREQALQPLRNAGVDLSRIATAPRTPTGLAWIMVPPDGQKSMVLIDNANASWPDEAAESAIAAIATAPEGSVLVLNYEAPRDLIHRAIMTATVRELPVVLDPSPPERVDPAYYGRLAAITPNAREAHALTGVEPVDTESACAAADRLANAGVRAVYLKLRDGGCLLSCGGKRMLLPSTDVEVVDTTGAGDAFAGALAVGLLEGRDPIAAGCLAVAAAQSAVTGFGAQSSYAGRDALERAAERVSGMARGV